MKYIYACLLCNLILSLYRVYKTMRGKYYIKRNPEFVEKLKNSQYGIEDCIHGDTMRFVSVLLFGWLILLAFIIVMIGGMFALIGEGMEKLNEYLLNMSDKIKNFVYKTFQPTRLYKFVYKMIEKYWDI